jgi:hypothetical protein
MTKKSLYRNYLQRQAVISKNALFLPKMWSFFYECAAINIPKIEGRVLG